MTEFGCENTDILDTELGGGSRKGGKSKVTADRAIKLWKEITVTLNAMGYEHHEWQQVKRKWQTMRSEGKRFSNMWELQNETSLDNCNQFLNFLT